MSGEWTLPPYVEKMSQSAADTAGFIPWGLTALGLPELHKKSTGKGRKLAIIDTGYAPSHPAFSGAVASQRDFTNDGLGVADGNGHGAHTAGTAGARRIPGCAHFGVAPECDLIIAKALDRFGAGNTGWINNALEWVIGLKPDVISMSLESPAPDPTMRQLLHAAKQAGIPVVTAAGNKGPLPGTVGYPAADSDLTIGVAARDQMGSIANFSATEQVGRDNQIDLCAPGVHIISCWPDGGYRYLDGTSMATPHVAAGLILMIDYRARNNLSPLNEFDTLNAAIKDTAKRITGVSQDRQGYGDFNLAGMLDYGVEKSDWVGKRFFPITEILGFTFELAVSRTPKK